MKKIILLIIEKIRKALKVDEKGNSFGWGKGTLLLTALMMVGCRYKITEANVREASSSLVIVDRDTGDSCEYYPSYGHKGTCRFCKERRQKELKELTEQLKGIRL